MAGHTEAMGVADLLLAGERDGAAYWEAVDTADAGDTAAVLALAGHSDAQVRTDVAMTLPLLTQGESPSAQMVAAAITLSRDPDARVRDAACFALAEQWREVDTPQVREALTARLDDADTEVRCEALLGLAHRHDPRALPRVAAALSRPSGEVWRLELVAAGALSDPRLHELVLTHKDGWDDEDTLTVQAVRALTDPTGPGTDLMDGVADLYRRRAHGHPDGEALAAWHRLDMMLDIAPHRAGEFLTRSWPACRTTPPPTPMS
jgi:hypothetical protein